MNSIVRFIGLWFLVSTFFASGCDDIFDPRKRALELSASNFDMYYRAIGFSRLLGPTELMLLSRCIGIVLISCSLMVVTGIRRSVGCAVLAVYLVAMSSIHTSHNNGSNIGSSIRGSASPQEWHHFSLIGGLIIASTMERRVPKARAEA
eukprot:Tbor_TRINITY_DN5306_c2_g5::TRINITY_DN5306_c2_g5_i1::g.4358::m.4358